MTVPRLTYFMLIVLLALPAAAADKGDPDIERFREMAAKGGDGREQLRLEIAEFVRARVGTPASPQAAAVLNQLPSPLDKLDPKLIPELERFAWQPKDLVAVLGEHRGRHGSPVSCLAWTRDGKRVISGGTQGYIRFWDPITLRQQARISSQGYPTCLSVSSDSKTLAAGTAAGVVHVWDISEQEPKLTGTFAIGTAPVHGIDISADGKLLAAGLYDTFVHVFDLDGSKAKVKTQLAGHKQAVRAVQFSPDSRTLATASSDGSFRWWGFPGGDKINELGTLQVHTGAISCMVHRGQQIVAGCDDGNIVRVNLGAKFTRGTGFKTPTAISAINFSPTGSLTTSHSDSQVRVWGNTTGAMVKPVAVVEGHFYSVAGFAYSPDGRTMATGSSDWTVRLWGMGGFKGTEKHLLRGHWIGPSPMVFSADTHLLGSVSGDRTARTWDVTKPTPVQTAMFPPLASLYRNEPPGLSSLAFTPDSKALAIAGSASAVSLWDIGKRMPIRTFTAPTSSVGGLVFTPDGRELYGLSGSWLFGWTTATAKETSKVVAADRYLNGLALSPDARFALAGTGYYVLEKGKPLMKDGKYVYQDVGIRLIDLRRGKAIQEVKELPAPMGGISFQPDGRGICAQWNAPPTLWSVARDAIKEGQPLKGFGSLGHPFVISPNQRRVLLSNTGVLRLADLEKETVLKQWSFDEVIYNYTFSPDSRYLAVSLVTGPIYILRLDEPPMPASGN